MFTHIRMKNFKSWKDSGEVKLAPLTGFFGTNSSGKSSLLQMLLLLKQTVLSGKILFFGNETSQTNLGNFREMIHGRNLNDMVELEFGYELQKPFTVRIPQRSNSDHDNYTTSVINGFVFDTAIRSRWGGLQVEYFRYSTEVSPDVPLEIKYQDSSLFLDGNQMKERVNMETCFGGPLIVREGKVEETDFLGKFASSFYGLFSRFYYLGPARVQPKYCYHWEGTNPDSVGQKGEYMIDSMLSARVDQQTTPYKGQKVPIEERISTWLQKMELGYSFSIKRTHAQDNRNYEVRIQKSQDSAEVMLAAMGYGLSQFLPVLVHCYYAPEGATLILEQPGIHLHPKAQADLADLLIEVITERKLQILIESHSEHLLNRLQRRVAEEKIAADQTAFYFCRHIDGASKIDKLDMDEFGNITNWPESFFGDEMGDLLAMTKAQRERQKKMTELIEGTTVAPSK